MTLLVFAVLQETDEKGNLPDFTRGVDSTDQRCQLFVSKIRVKHTDV